MGMRVSMVRMVEREWSISTWKWEAFSVSAAPHQLACWICEDCVISKSIMLEFRYLWEL